MKKVITVLLVLALAITALSAANIKVGAELGYGVDILKVSGKNGDTKISQKYLNRGIAANITGEYGFNDNFGIKLSAGVMYGFKAKVTSSNSDDGSNDKYAPKNSGLYLDLILDGKYSFNINEKFAVSSLAGVEMLYGYLLKKGNADDKAAKNLALGINAGLEVSYMIIDNLSINGGVSASWMFVNTNKSINDMKKASSNAHLNNFYIRPYVGAQYAF